MEMEENQAQISEQTGETTPDAGEQEDFESLIRGRYKGRNLTPECGSILDGRSVGDAAGEPAAGRSSSCAGRRTRAGGCAACRSEGGDPEGIP